MDDTPTAAGLTVGGILSMHNQTLLDLIRRDDHRHIHSKKTWKMLRDKLRLKLVGSVCATTVPIVASHVRIITGGNRSNSPPANNTSENVRSEPPAKVSLMALLEVDGCAYLDDEEEEEEESGGDVYKYNNKCCVCMVRHKGAAFIPCGHTFCRHCSRELFAIKPNCPLCNNFIFQILDIF